MKKTEIAILGGDKRQEYMAKMFEKNYIVQKFMTNEQDLDFYTLHKTFDIYIFPVPISKDDVHLNAINQENQHKLVEIIEKIPPKSIVLGGSVSKSVSELFAAKNLKIIDYFESEKLAILNAVPIVLGKFQLNAENLVCIINRT